MKTGKASEAVLDRSVLRPLHKVQAAGAQTAFGEDCAFWQNQCCASVSGTVGGTFDRTPEMMLENAVCGLAVSGARAEYAMISVVFPAEWDEKELKRLMNGLSQAAGRLEISIAGGHTEISDAVTRPVLTLTVSGSRMTEKSVFDGRTAALRPGQDLVMAGYAGLAGTVVLALAGEERLKKRYPFTLMEAARAFDVCDAIREAARACIHFGVSAMHDVSQGGVFGALWEMAECAGVGLEVGLKKIPIRQETIEITEFFDCNPYQLYGQGALLAGTDRGDALVTELQNRGIRAAVIGRTTSENGRLIRNGEEVRYLDRPAQDELWRLSR